MRASRVATALVVLTAGLTASVLRRRLGGLRHPVVASPLLASVAGRTAGAHAAVPAAPAQPPVPADRDAVVLSFAPRIVPTTAPTAPTAPTEPAVPARCGDDGGLTKAGAPCRTRATSGGRCHHHRRRDVAA